MNKNTRSKLKARRELTRSQMSQAVKGRRIISCNDPAIARRKYASGCQVVYQNVDADGKAISITRHEAIAADGGHVKCRSKVGGRGVHGRESKETSTTK